jgi:hypothetical protein
MKFVEEQQNSRPWGKTVRYIHMARCLGLTALDPSRTVCSYVTIQPDDGNKSFLQNVGIYG